MWQLWLLMSSIFYKVTIANILRLVFVILMYVITLTSTLLGIEPRGSSAWVSWILTFWKSTNLDLLTSSMNRVRLAHWGFRHTRREEAILPNDCDILLVTCNVNWNVRILFLRTSFFNWQWDHFGLTLITYSHVYTDLRFPLSEKQYTNKNWKNTESTVALLLKCKVDYSPN